MEKPHNNSIVYNEVKKIKFKELKIIYPRIAHIL